jgi:hypothetical protein
MRGDPSPARPRAWGRQWTLREAVTRAEAAGAPRASSATVEAAAPDELATGILSQDYSGTRMPSAIE